MFMEVTPMSRRHFQSDSFSERAFKKENPIEKKIDLDDVNEIATDEEVVEEKEPEVKIEKKETKPEPEPKFVKGIVKVLSNMRANPSLEAAVIEVLPVGESIMIYDTPGEFYKVVHNDVTGYVKKDLCARVGSGISHLI
jgi:hypothetical protein